MARLIRTEKEVEGRYEEVWLVVEEDALEQWPAGPREVVGRPATRIDGLERARGEAVYTADLQLPGMLHTAVLRSPYAHARVARIDLAPALAMPGVHAAIGPGDIDVLVDECGFQGAAVAAVCADTYAQARAALSRVEVDFEQLEVLLDPDEAVARGPAARRAARSRARRPRAAARGGGRRRHRRVPHPGRAAQLDGDPPGGRAVARRHARGLHLDAVHLGRPRRDREHARPARRQGARDLQLHGRRLRLEERRRRLHVHRDRAREADAPAGALRAHAARGEHRERQPQRDDPAPDGRRARRRHADRARRRVRERHRLGRLVVPGRGPDADALRVREREDHDLGGEDQPAADEGVPRAGVRRGDVRARVPARRARGEARHRPARAAPPQPREPRCRRRQAVQRQEPAGVLPPRRAALGAPPRGARTLDRDGQARRRDGVADLVRRRRPAELRLDARRLGRPRDGGHGDAGHRHRHAHGDGADRRRGARHPARPRHRLARRLGPRPVRLDLGRLVDDAVDGAGRPRGRSRRAAPDRGDRGAARHARRSAGGDRRPARGARRSSARAGAARTPPACRC